MKLPPWLKFENLLGKLNLSGWLMGRGWFKHKEQLNFTEDKIALAEYSDNDVFEDIRSSDQLKFEFSADQKFLIEKVNQIHVLNGRRDYDFKNDYGSALYHIKYKSSPTDWFITAAVFMSNAVPDGGIRNILNYFEKRSDPDKEIALDGYKKSLQSSYNNLQNLRHANKKGDLQQSLLSTYEREVLKITEIPAERIEPIFKKFESDLLKIFGAYKLKNN